LYRDVKVFKKGYQSRTKIVKDEKCGLFADSYTIVVRWRKNFSQLLNVQWFNHTPEPLVPEPNAFEVQMVIVKLKRHK